VSAPEPWREAFNETAQAWHAAYERDHAEQAGPALFLAAA
jgi:hypothetical protein